MKLLCGGWLFLFAGMREQFTELSAFVNMETDKVR